MPSARPIARGGDWEPGIAAKATGMTGLQQSELYTACLAQCAGARVQCDVLFAANMRCLELQQYSLQQ